MAVLMLALAFLVGAAQQRMIKTLKEGTQQVKRWSGVVLMLAGVWLIALAIWAGLFSRLLPV